MLLLPLLLLSAHAKEVPWYSGVVKRGEKCRPTGLFLRHDSTKPHQCYPCFCQKNGTPVCWPNEPCSLEKFQNISKRNMGKRYRRSPDIGLMENQMRDEPSTAAPPQECTPFQNSRREDCPPGDDRCKGCKVCDCNAQGRWDCRITSYCPEDANSNQLKAKRGLNQKNFKTKDVTPLSTRNSTEKNKLKNRPKNFKAKLTRPRASMNKYTRKTNASLYKNTQTKKFIPNLRSKEKTKLKDVKSGMKKSYAMKNKPAVARKGQTFTPKNKKGMNTTSKRLAQQMRRNNGNRRQSVKFTKKPVIKKKATPKEKARKSKKLKEKNALPTSTSVDHSLVPKDKNSNGPTIPTFTTSNKPSQSSPKQKSTTTLPNKREATILSKIIKSTLIDNQSYGRTLPVPTSPNIQSSGDVALLQSYGGSTSTIAQPSVSRTTSNKQQTKTFDLVSASGEIIKPVVFTKRGYATSLEETWSTSRHMMSTTAPKAATTPTSQEIRHTINGMVLNTKKGSILHEQMMNDGTAEKHVTKRSIVKRVKMVKPKKATKPNKTRSVNSKPIPKKKQKRKIAVEKSNRVKVNKKRPKRSIAGSIQTSYDTQSKVEFENQKDHIKVGKRFNKEMNDGLQSKTTGAALPKHKSQHKNDNAPSTLDILNKYYLKLSYTIDDSNKNTTNISNNELPEIVPLNERNSTSKRSLHDGNSTRASNLAIFEIDFKNKTIPSVVYIDSYNFTSRNWSNAMDTQNEVLSKSESVPISAITFPITNDSTAKTNNTKVPIAKDDVHFSLERHIHGIELKKITVPKKHKLLKLVPTLSSKIRSSAHNDSVATVMKGKVTLSKFENFRKLIHKIFLGFSGNSTTKHNYTRRHVKIIRYLKNFFQKLFAKIKRYRNQSSKTTEIQLTKKSVLETLCETFGPCNINPQNKDRLHRDISALNIETYRMLKSIRIIKNLLESVEFGPYDAKIYKEKNMTTRTAFKHDIHKLHSILKGAYETDENFKKLSLIEQAHLRHIKNNTQQFIKSATRFAVILNDIVNSLTTFDMTDTEHKHVPRDMSNVVGSKDFRIMNRTKLSRPVKSNNSEITRAKILSGIHNDQFTRIKKLILKYSLLQNSFMKKILKLIASVNDVDLREMSKVLNETTKFKKSSKGSKDTVINNKTEAIHTYTKNIIRNLRKLKDLAQTLTFRSDRRKREITDDDGSLEYFLMFMEYLLRHNQAAEVSPVNDGIDLILNAIDNAPDIHSIRKNILEHYTSEKTKTKMLTKDFNTTHSIQSANESKNLETVYLQFLNGDEVENSTFIDENFRVDTPNTDDPLHDDEEYDRPILLNKRIVNYDKRKINRIHAMTNKIDDFIKHIVHTPRIIALQKLKAQTSPPRMKTQTLPPKTTMASPTIQLKARQTPSIVFATSGEIVRQVDFELDEKRESTLKYELFDDGFDEGASSPSSSTTSPDSKMEIINDPTPYSFYANPLSTEKLVVIKRRDSGEFITSSNVKSESGIDNESTNGPLVDDNKSTADWFDDSYEDDIKEKMPKVDFARKPAPPIFSLKTINNKLCLRNETKKCNKEKSQEDRTDTLVYKKEMDLLKSLDYGTGEKSVKDRSDSRNSVEDKYNSESFGSDFP